MALTTAFARNGNRTTIPQTTTNGSVSYDQGFGSFYALPPEEGGLFIDRAQFNQLMYDTTEQVLANKTAIETKANASETVKLTTNQTIQGVKTFSSPPVSATNPTANNQVANKAYVDTVGNTAVKLTGAQSIAGAKTFSNNIAAPNITAMQNSINAINTSLSTVVSDTFTPYLILKSSALGLKSFYLNDGDGQDEINAIIAEAAKYRMFRININGTVTGDINFSNINYGEVVFNWETSAKLIGNLSVQSDSTIRIVRLTLENGTLNAGRLSKILLLSDVNITAPTSRGAIELGSGSILFTDQTTSYPVKPFNLTSDTYGISIDNGASFIAGRSLTINTTNTTTKINLSRGSFVSLTGTTITGDGADFNIATNTVTAAGIIMR